MKPFQKVRSLRILPLAAALFLSGCGSIKIAQINADQHQITQVFTNLLMNAYEAMGGKGRVTISAEMLRLEDGSDARDAVLVELPIGLLSYDARYMFCSSGHWRRLVNGMSGVFPDRYPAAASSIMATHVKGRALWDAVTQTGATHVIVHRGAWRDGTGTRIAGWLESIGAHVVTGSGDALLYQVATTERLAQEASHPGAVEPMMTLRWPTHGDPAR